MSKILSIVLYSTLCVLFMSGSVLTNQKRTLHTTKRRMQSTSGTDTGGKTAPAADANDGKEINEACKGEKGKPYKWPNDSACHKEKLEPDQGCTPPKPFMCGDGKCIASWNLCGVILQKCMGPLNFYSCMNGECMMNAEECRNAVDQFNKTVKPKKNKEVENLEKLKITPCEDSLTHVKCEDGFCRRSCKNILSSRCDLQSPYACGYGTCQSF